MKTADWGETIGGTRSEFLRLKNKGDRVQFRIAQKPVYEVKHFQQTDEGWNVTSCPRMEGDDCELCKNFFELKAVIKKFKAAENVDNSNAEVKKMENEARKFAPTTQFYFSILDRETQAFVVLQTTSGVRNKFNEHYESGVDVMSKEWVLRNTGSDSPRDLYALSMVDSADVKPLTPEEEDEFQKARSFDLSTVAQGGGNDE